MNTVTKPELPIAMVALGATAVYAVILEWKDGIRSVKPFDSNLYAKVYKEHVVTIKAMQSDHPKAFHFSMHELYCHVR
ncbi:hypothetical protein BDQ17DRAFT_1250258 [Cyathus striatus]|nr:hypothetical protein BDQ17DRAFT_1250258 [Cyathus striatus]